MSFAKKMPGFNGSYYVVVTDRQAWRKQTKLIAVKYKDGTVGVVCSTCRTTPTFGGWCSGAATWGCVCGIEQGEDE